MKLLNQSVMKCGVLGCLAAAIVWQQSAQAQSSDSQVEYSSPAAQTPSVSPRGDVVVKGFIPDYESARIAASARVEEAESTATAAKKNAGASVAAKSTSRKSVAKPSSEKASSSTAKSIKASTAEVKTKGEIVDLDSAIQEAPESANPAAKKTKASVAKQPSKSAAKKQKQPVKITSSANEKKEQKSAKVTYDIQTNAPGREAVVLERKDFSQHGSRATDDIMSVEGVVVSLLHSPGGTLNLLLDSESGEMVQGIVTPGYGVRVPSQGSKVRLSGRRVGASSRGPVLRIEQIERISSAGSAAAAAPIEPPYAAPPFAAPPFGGPAPFGPGPIGMPPPPMMMPPPPHPMF